MNNPAENLLATSKVTLEAAQALAVKTQASVEKLVDLNMATSKANLNDSIEGVKAVLSAKDPQALAAVASGMASPMAAKSAQYAQEFQKIVAGAHEEFTKAVQTNLADIQKGFTTLIQSATENAPAGTDAATAFFNQSMNAFKSAQTSAQQAIDAAQANFAAASGQISDAVKKATKAAK